MAPQSQTCNPSGQPGLFHPALSRSVDTPLGYKHPHQWHWLFSVKPPCLYHWDQERQLHAPLTTHVTQQLKFSNQPSQSLHPQPLQTYGLPAWSPGHASSLLEDMGSITPTHVPIHLGQASGQPLLAAEDCWKTHHTSCQLPSINFHGESWQITLGNWKLALTSYQLHDYTLGKYAHMNWATKSHFCASTLT